MGLTNLARAIPVREPREPWNLNIHYDRLLADRVRPGQRVLEVGCGDGFLSARLADQGCEVVALDADTGVLGRARERWPDHRIEWVKGDALTHPFQPESFDAVVSNATLHHLPDAGAGLRRFAELLRPDGTLGVVGFATNGPLDWPMSLAGSVGIFVLTRVRGKWEHTAPVVWPAPHTYGEVRRLSGEVLPGRRFRKLWLGRYLLTWVRPDA
ncbi:class I SAM-dependent methyltransferase [Mariniluteicoccus endophyticus]